MSDDEEELTTDSYEEYSPLDELGRCQTAEACVGEDLMPTQKRESISSVKPTGWVNKEYDLIDGGYLYNRCHLIGFQLTGENANERNLITGTRYMNVDGMLPFEDEVADYVKETDNHVMYRVTPIYSGDDLVASGVQMEAKSVEDDGAGVTFNVYVYNVQPYVVINYETGESYQTEELATPEGEWAPGTEAEVTDKNYMILGFLHAMKDIRTIPDSNVKDSVKILSAKIGVMSEKEIAEISKYALLFFLTQLL